MQNMQNCRPRCPGKGFTLAEILIALGILAIGMSMVAAIFPAALEFNRRSTNSTLGTMICENGLVLSELELTAEMVNAGDLRVAPGSPTQLAVYADDMKCTDKNAKYPLSQAELHYPTGDAESRTGFVMLVRQTVGSTYQIVTVAYRKTNKNNTVELKEVTCTISGRDITVASPGYLRIGTPLINKTTGIFAMVDSINSAGANSGTKGTLDIDPNVRKMDGNVSCYVLLERTSTGGNIPVTTMRLSPAIGAMSKMTGLKHDPQPTPTTATP
ncbi:MAG: prepilin-type N-terminal cleavage/methylation domain-containing protein [Phycisphaerae bacterium]|nr:prepilin-type N-terminal cleavage/methylation domain-containing protein [Phycisphaerae bacterium]